MPLYEYSCESCGRDFEKMMRFDQSGERPSCPSCESTKTRKKLSLFASGGVSTGDSSSSSCGSSSSGFS